MKHAFFKVNRGNNIVLNIIKFMKFKPTRNIKSNLHAGFRTVPIVIFLAKIIY